ncbi:MAG: glycosyltransferase family 4 protein [Rubrobacter sp.]|nr:glycosyltransferase family 4 protein [Rubrobacter sp.]
MSAKPRVVYMHSPSRKSGKLLPLLEGLTVVSVRGWRDLLRLRPAPDDVVVMDQFGRWALFGLVASVFLRAPLVIRLRGEFFREERERADARPGASRWPRYLLNVLLGKLCFRRATKVLCNSHYLARATSTYARPEKIAVVLSPYTAPGDGPAPDLPRAGLRLATVSDMVLHSKVRPLFETIQSRVTHELLEELDVQWLICGSGYHEERLRALVQQKGLQGRVHVLGRVEGVSEVYEWCDVLVHLTGLDALPSVPMEAMMHTKPVITNVDSCGTRELVFDGENGLVVRDSYEFAAALGRYAKDPTLRERHGRSGRSFVEENLSVPLLRNQMQRVLRETVSSGKSRTGG